MESLELYSKVNPRIVEEHYNTLHTVLVSINWFVNTHTNANNYDINIIIMMDNCKVLLIKYFVDKLACSVLVRYYVMLCFKVIAD